jgi:peptide deformylase
MKTLADLVLLGDPRLYEKCELILESELPQVAGWVADLHNVMAEIRARFNFGRGIAAPQIGVMKRLVYLHLQGRPIVLINPELVDLSRATFELWDDCMSFPNLLVRVSRHQTVTVKYTDENWQPQTWTVHNDLAELLQHECDHLDGVLCTMRALDAQSFKWRP